MFRNNTRNKAAAFNRNKLPKLSADEQRALARPRTEADLEEDAKEIYIFLTDMLIGALIEPGRDGETWCRRWIRDALAKDTLKRAMTRQILRSAQHREGCFKWCLEYWQEFDLQKAKPEELAHHRISFMDFNEPVKDDAWKTKTNARNFRPMITAS